MVIFKLFPGWTKMFTALEIRDLEDQDQITILILRSRSDLEDQDHAHLWK